MSARITQRTDESRTSFATSSAGTFTIRTNDPLLSHATVPMATVMLGFGKQSGLRAVSTPPPLPNRAATSASVAEPVLETGLSSTSIDHPHRPTHTEHRQWLLDAAETPAAAEKPKEPLELAGAAAEPVATAVAAPGEAAEASQEAAEHDKPSSEKPAHPHRLEMTIDSLPHHELTEPIPIVIDPLGDTIFTATISNLDISATGNSISEGLVLLKEQIGFIYGDLSRRSNLTPDQKTTLQILHTYIRPNGPKKPEWF